MEATWREERPEAITTLSASEERPVRSMVTTCSALSSSSEARMRVISSEACALGAGSLAFLTFFGAGLRAACFFAAGFFAVGFLATGRGAAALAAFFFRTV